MKNSFDFSATEDFDDHIRRSIPQVEEMYRLCHAVTAAFAQSGSVVIDLGCSTGKFLLETPQRFGVDYIGIDTGKWERGTKENVTFRNYDILGAAQNDFFEPSSVILSLFTLQFLPYAERVEVIERAAEGLVDGGCMIVAEKVHLPDAGLAEVIERDLIQWKRQGFDDKDILDKSAQLAVSLRRSPQADLINVMQKNFSTVNIIWAHGQFICAVGVKG
ncbi:MAG: Synechococcus phage [Pseudomonadota bacterium]